jgi:hypothetical protein
MFAKTLSWRRAQWLAVTLLLGICVQVQAEPTTRVSGSVLDAQGKPLADVPVGIVSSKHVQALREARPKLALATRTDASGRFQLSLPRSLGRVTVVAQRRDLLSVQQWADLDVRQRELRPLRLSPGLTLTGRVSDAAGRPLPGVKIFGDAWPEEDSTVGPLRQFFVETGKDGSFVSAGLAARPYRVHAELAGYGTWERAHVHVDDDADSRTLAITLYSAAYLSGLVTDVSGRPLSGVKLTQGDSPRIVAMTDGAGRFRLGPYAKDSQAAVSVTRPGYVSEHLTVRMPRDDLQLVLTRTGVLRGRVVDAATRSPVQDFQIGFRWRNAGEHSNVLRTPVPVTVTARDGRFELKDIVPGLSTVTALARGYAPREVPGVEIMAGEATPELLIELQRGITLRGRVIDQASGEPLAGVSITSGGVLEAKLREVMGWGHAGVTSDDRGAFVLEGLPAGTVTINAESSDHRPWARSMVLAQDSSMDVALNRGAVIAGQVLAADGLTPAEGWISLLGQDGDSATSTDAQGHFELDHQAPGRYRVKAYTKTQVTAWTDVTVTEDQQLEGVKLVLHAAPMIRGTITGLSAPELQQLQVNEMTAQTAPDGRWWWSTTLMQQSMAEVDGTAYRLKPSKSGGVIVIAGPAQGPQVHKRIEVPERGDVTVDFDFAGGMQVAGRVTRAGQPAAGIAMWAIPDEGQPVAGFTETTADGEYRFADLAGGRYRIGPAKSASALLQMTGSVVHDVELPAP